MKKLSVRKFSLLGLALMGASALTAAFLPSNAKSVAFAQGVITAGADRDSNPLQQTCRPATGGFNCNNTVTGAGVSRDTAAGVASLSNATTANDL